MSHADLQRRAEAAFISAFGAAPKACVQAPGRVNLIGEHTDYNDGFVLPCAIDRGTVIALRRRTDRRVRVVALDYAGARDEFDLTQPLSREGEVHWSHYVRGMAQQLLSLDPSLPGLDMLITGDVPQGAGLSSSASLEVAVGAAFRAAGAIPTLDPTQLALLAQRAENEFVGCQCGIMDQLVSARGEAGSALLIDCRSLSTKTVTLPEGAAVLIAHSMVRRGLVDSHYNERREACAAATRYLGVNALRDVTLDQLATSGLDALTHRRARHVVTENYRTLRAAEVLERGDLAAVASLMAASHASMRDDFEITVPAVDQLVELITDTLAGEGGCRMTGGGFGGCVVALMPKGRVAAVEAAISRHYRSPEGLASKVFVCQPSAGAGALISPLDFGANT
ncbi:galactokinase [Roseateles toxinivorans]|uniref:Galactokinase n=1 Tax=Roseateles toxinivorans TaxID=270368 RepID=A0A4R6QEX0_9BURK|nr:galactokinase [Roseateles toxinivorans]TDP60483.1 galactokinase [Roseateles toxinivorans]